MSAATTFTKDFGPEASCENACLGAPESQTSDLNRKVMLHSLSKEDDVKHQVMYLILKIKWTCSKEATSNIHNAGEIPDSRCRANIAQ